MKEDKSTDWSTLMRAHDGLSSYQVAHGMSAAEAVTTVRLTEIDDEAEAAGRQLHFARTMLCRREALSIIPNS